MLRRVDIQHAATENGDRPATGGDGATVCGCVDPAGQAAGDGVPGAREPAGELLGDSPPVGIGMARADDRHGERIGRHKGAAHKEDRRRIGDRGEEPRVVGIPFEDDLHVLALAETERLVGKPPVGVLADRSGYFCTDAIDPLQRRSRGGKDGRGRAERGEEHPMGPSADPLHAGKVDAIAERSLPRGQAIGRGVVVGDVGVLVGLVHECVGRHERAPPMASADRLRQRCWSSERLYRCSPRGGERQRTGRSFSASRPASLCAASQMFDAPRGLIYKPPCGWGVQGILNGGRCGHAGEQVKQGEGGAIGRAKHTHTHPFCGGAA